MRNLDVSLGGAADCTARQALPELTFFTASVRRRDAVASDQVTSRHVLKDRAMP